MEEKLVQLDRAELWVRLGPLRHKQDYLSELRVIRAVLGSMLFAERHSTIPFKNLVYPTNRLV
jgi:hypothetical protein